MPSILSLDMAMMGVTAIAGGLVLLKAALKLGLVGFSADAGVSLQQAKEQIVADGCKYVETTDGRVVEYLVSGSNKPDARILVQFPGGLDNCKTFSAISANVAKVTALNVKVISISAPGYGCSTPKPGRMYRDFPLDVELVLEREGVTGSFAVMGGSQGCEHAFAVLSHYKKRVDALGLRAPSVGHPGCSEALGLKNTGSKKFGFDSTTVNSTVVGFLCGCFYAKMTSGGAPDFSKPLSPLVKTMAVAFGAGHEIAVYDTMIAEMRNEGKFLDEFGVVAKRKLIYGGVGAMWSCCSDLHDSCPDVRELTQPPKVLLWYASNDGDKPPEHSIALSKVFHSAVLHDVGPFGHGGAYFIDMPGFLQALMG